jgi:hypothetical protein
MKYSVRYVQPQDDEIDLEDYGHSPETKWDDLTEEEQNEILDPLRSKIINIHRIEQETE